MNHGSNRSDILLAIGLNGKLKLDKYCMSSSIHIALSDVIDDSPAFRAQLQRNEDELEALNRWILNATRVFKSYLEDATSTTHTIPDAFPCV